MSTAITSSAPICRAKRTGTGDTRPPSTYSRVPMRTGWNTAGTALEARTATPVSPTLEQDGLAVVQVGGDDAQRQRHLLDAACRRCARARSAPAPRRGSARGRGNDQSVMRRLVHRLRPAWPARRRSCPTRTAPPPGCRPRCRRPGRAGCRLPPAPGSRRCGRSRAPRRRPAPGRCAAACGGGLARRGRRHGQAVAGGGVWHAARRQPAPARQPASARAAATRIVAANRRSDVAGHGDQVIILMSI